jgi:hypothetical protein
MALMWHSQDVPALLELALLRDVYGRSSLAKEVRLRSNSFGLTPYGRQQCRWLIMEDEIVESPDELAEQRRKAERHRSLRPS